MGRKARGERGVRKSDRRFPTRPSKTQLVHGTKESRVIGVIGSKISQPGHAGSQISP